MELRRNRQKHKLHHKLPAMRKESAKRVLLAEFLILALLIFGVFGTVMGFFMDKDLVSNRFTIGYNKSNITEEFGSYDKFEAGKTYTKKVSVTNTGSVPCYVRVYAKIENNEDNYTVDYNRTNWAFRSSDGYYYYMTAVAPGEKTEPLFTSIKNSSDKDSTDFSMICYEETVQTDTEAHDKTGLNEILACFTDVKGQ